MLIDRSTSVGFIGSQRQSYLMKNGLNIGRMLLLATPLFVPSKSPVEVARDHTLPLYDALIVASATEAGCDTLFSEDMQHSRAIGGLAIVNPFLESAQ
jgi:predicted nucleic acid-binding protein